MRLFLLFLSIFLALPVLANTPSSSPIQRVLYVTLDGTRWQDVYLDHSHFAKLWTKYASQLHFYGQPEGRAMMGVASIPVSLPSYHSQMAGHVQPCDGNECGRIRVQTVLENLVQKLNLKKKDVAVFASWDGIGEAIESNKGTIYSSVGNVPVYDPDTLKADPIMHALNKKQKQDKPKGPYVHNERYDKYTFAYAMHYFEKHKPRFMWISLNDADVAAHRGDLKGYHQVLASYDAMLDSLFVTLKKLKLDKTTLVIVTTDHGRGNGENWRHHGPKYPESKRTWAFVMNGELKSAGVEGRYSTLSIRPTIEAAFAMA